MFAVDDRQPSFTEGRVCLITDTFSPSSAHVITHMRMLLSVKVKSLCTDLFTEQVALVGAENCTSVIA